MHEAARPFRCCFLCCGYARRLRLGVRQDVPNRRLAARNWTTGQYARTSGGGLRVSSCPRHAAAADDSGIDRRRAEEPGARTDVRAGYPEDLRQAGAAGPGARSSRQTGGKAGGCGPLQASPPIRTRRFDAGTALQQPDGLLARRGTRGKTRRIGQNRSKRRRFVEIEQWKNFTASAACRRMCSSR